MERHQQAVAGFLLSVLRDLDASQEAVQTAFLKAYQNIARFEGRSSFKTWVCRIAMNEARSELRKAALRRWVPFGVPKDGDSGAWEEGVRAVAGKQPDLDRKLDLERAMQVLSPREREIAALRLEGYGLGEVAEILGVSEGTVKSTLFTATRKMRERLS